MNRPREKQMCYAANMFADCYIATKHHDPHPKYWLLKAEITIWNFYIQILFAIKHPAYWPSAIGSVGIGLIARITLGNSEKWTETLH